MLHSRGHPKGFTELHGEEKREEGNRGDKEKRGIKRGESKLASNQFPMCSPQPETPREVHRFTQRREQGEMR